MTTTAKKAKPSIEYIHDYNIDVKNRIIYLNSEFTWGDNETESGVEYQMYSRFAKNMDILNNENDSPISIKSANIGGDWYYGMAMYDCIKRSKAPTNFYIDAYACSMGSIIPQAATKRYISRWVGFLVHLGQISVSGDKKAAISTFQYYASTIHMFGKIYSERCVNGPFFIEKGFTQEEVAKYIVDMMDAKTEWWMTSEEAIHYGFADEIY
jgi:ATP-dependent protease ClpP protease subunit